VFEEFESKTTWFEINLVASGLRWNIFRVPRNPRRVSGGHPSSLLP
jgi:hypothetical protein